jgi:hypothetical protein
MKTPRATLSVSELLGENYPAKAENRRIIRAALIKTFKLDPKNQNAFWDQIDKLIKQAISRRSHVLRNPSDQLKRRDALARITAAVILASDDEGRHLRRLRETCLAHITITRETPLLALALKAFGPYEYAVAERRRSADKMVSRDYNAIQFVLLKRVPPTAFVRFWGVRGQGLDECSRKLLAHHNPRAKKTNSGDGLYPMGFTPRQRAIMTALPEGTRLIAHLVKRKNGTYKIDSLKCEGTKAKTIPSFENQPTTR